MDQLTVSSSHRTPRPQHSSLHLTVVSTKLQKNTKQKSDWLRHFSSSRDPSRLNTTHCVPQGNGGKETERERKTNEKDMLKHNTTGLGVRRKSEEKGTEGRQSEAITTFKHNWSRSGSGPIASSLPFSSEEIIMWYNAKFLIYIGISYIIVSLSLPLLLSEKKMEDTHLSILYSFRMLQSDLSFNQPIIQSINHISFVIELLKMTVPGQFPQFHFI